MKRAGTDGTAPGHFDLTGFTWSYNLLQNPNYPGYMPPQAYSYSSTAYLSAPGTVVPQFTGPGQPDLAYHYSESGTSTFRWQWVPPNKPDGTPDTQNFPAPILFVLGRVDGYAVYDVDPDAPGTASFSISDGWGWNVSKSSTTDGYFYQLDSSLLPRRKLLTADENNQVTVSTAFSASAVGSATTSAMVFGYVDKGVFPILLSSPDPFVRPDIRELRTDDRNQIVYDASSSRLEIPAMITVRNGSGSDLDWLIKDGSASSLVDWTFSRNLPWRLGYTRHKALGGITPRSITGGISYDSFIATQLPQSNNDFGTYIITLKIRVLNASGQLESKESQKAYIQTFFPATATNHPGGNPENPPSSTNVPNWYYYFTQVASTNDQLYENDSTPSYYDPNTNAIAIHNDAYTGNETDVFIFVIGDDGLFRRTDESLWVGGIHEYLYTLGHELGHRYYFLEGIDNPGGHAVDTDEDGLSDAWENAHNLHPNRRDTTGAYGTGYIGDEASGDEQLIADVYALKVLKDYKLAHQYDWSDYGLQKGAPRSPYPWRYGASSPDPPANAKSGVLLP